MWSVKISYSYDFNHSWKLKLTIYLSFNACQEYDNGKDIDLIFVLILVFLFFLFVGKISCLQFVYSLGLLIKQGKGNWNADWLIDKFHSISKHSFYLHELIDFLTISLRFLTKREKLNTYRCVVTHLTFLFGMTLFVKYSGIVEFRWFSFYSRKKLKKNLIFKPI